MLHAIAPLRPAQVQEPSWGSVSGLGWEGQSLDPAFLPVLTGPSEGALIAPAIEGSG